jgi:hypothetical protein
MEQLFISTHKLDFESAPWNSQLDPADNWMLFRIGTCEGVWRATEHSYDILAITNNEPNNGHFTDVLEWFENSCKRDGKKLRILEVWNEVFKNHLITKKGFSVIPMTDHVVKDFRNRAIVILGSFTAAHVALETVLKHAPIVEPNRFPIKPIPKFEIPTVITNPITEYRSPRSIRREKQRKSKKRK